MFLGKEIFNVDNTKEALIRRNGFKYMCGILKYYHRLRGNTYRELGAILSLSPAYTSSVINEERIPSKALLLEFIRVLGIPKADSDLQVSKTDQLRLDAKVLRKARGNLVLEYQKLLSTNPKLAKSLMRLKRELNTELGKITIKY